MPPCPRRPPPPTSAWNQSARHDHPGCATDPQPPAGDGGGDPWRDPGLAGAPLLLRRSLRLRLRGPGHSWPWIGIDLLITAPDAWLEWRNRFAVLNQLWGLLARADVSLDLLLYSERECEERRQWRTHVIGRAFRGGGCWMVLSEPEGLLRLGGDAPLTHDLRRLV